MKNTPAVLQACKTESIPPWAATAAAAAATARGEAFFPGSGKLLSSKSPLLASFFSTAGAGTDVSISAAHAHGWQTLVEMTKTVSYNIAPKPGQKNANPGHTTQLLAVKFTPGVFIPRERTWLISDMFILRIDCSAR